MSSWKTDAEEEIRLGLAERAEGKEGRARVRARRAAGYVVGEYLRRRALPDPGPNAYERLKLLLTLPDVPPEAIQAARHLTMRVNMAFQLPPGVDLFVELQRLSRALLDETLTTLPPLE